MKAYQLFQQISPALGTSIFQELRDNHKEIYKSSLMSLAQQKKLRPVFIQRKPGPQQVEWMYATSKLKVADSVAEHVLQIWLLKAQQPMLIEFLDALGIEHDDEGTVEDLPETLDAKKLKSAVDQLLKSHPRETVALYLHMFQLQRPEGWDEIKELMEQDDRLYLGNDPAPPALDADETVSTAEATPEPEADSSAEKEVP